MQHRSSHARSYYPDQDPEARSRQQSTYVSTYSDGSATNDSYAPPRQRMYQPTESTQQSESTYRFHQDQYNTHQSYWQPVSRSWERPNPDIGRTTQHPALDSTNSPSDRLYGPHTRSQSHRVATPPYASSLHTTAPPYSYSYSHSHSHSQLTPQPPQERSRPSRPLTSASLQQVDQSCTQTTSMSMWMREHQRDAPYHAVGHVQTTEYDDRSDEQPSC